MMLQRYVFFSNEARKLQKNNLLSPIQPLLYLFSIRVTTLRSFLEVLVSLLAILHNTTAKTITCGKLLVNLSFGINQQIFALQG